MVPATRGNPSVLAFKGLPTSPSPPPPTPVVSLGTAPQMSIEEVAQEVNPEAPVGVCPRGREARDVLVEVMGESHGVRTGLGEWRGAGGLSWEAQEALFCTVCVIINLKRKTLSTCWDCSVGQRKMEKVYRREGVSPGSSDATLLLIRPPGSEMLASCWVSCGGRNTG